MGVDDVWCDVWCDDNVWCDVWVLMMCGVMCGC